MMALEPADTARLSALAQRLVWWKTPGEALADRHRFLAQVMKLGSWNDILEAEQFWPQSAFREVLRNAPPGLFDARSWSYWHHVLDLQPIPPLPTRKLPES